MNHQEQTNREKKWHFNVAGLSKNLTGYVLPVIQTFSTEREKALRYVRFLLLLF